MKLDNEYRVEYDSNSVMLKYEKPSTRINKQGEEVDYLITDTWYYPNLKQALKQYLNKVIESPNIKEVVKKIEAVEKLIQVKL